MKPEMTEKSNMIDSDNDHCCRPRSRTDAKDRDSLFWHDFLLRDAVLPHEASSKIRGPDGPLRWILLLLPPHRVIRAILDSHGPEIRSSAARAGNRVREKALHQALDIGSCCEVVRLVLENEPTAAQRRDASGKLPLHCVWRGADAAEAVLAAHPQAFMAQDRSGSIPLHYAVRRGSANVVRSLISCAGGLAAEGALAVDSLGDTPLSLACDALLRPSPDKGENVIWSKIETIAMAAILSLEGNARSATRTPFLVLHTVLELGCPAHTVMEALRRNPNQSRERDTLGRLPLHIACGSKGGRRPPLAAASVIRALLRSSEGGYPCAAKSPDAEGRLPLHLAVEGGLEISNGLDHIFYAAPRSLENLDVRTQMYAFALAAVGEESCLDTVYWLLRKAPAVLVQCFSYHRLECG